MNDALEILKDRAILEITGDEAEHFLENLVTCKVSGLAPQDARFGALLTPQGKILFDFFLVRTEAGFLLDTATNQSEDLLKRLVFYRLRAKVDLNGRPDLQVCWTQGDSPDGAIIAFVDPRHADLGKRCYGTFEVPECSGDTGRLHELRVQLGIPESGKDFHLSDAYPHEVLMDQFGGVDFRKGCYVGQEVVSRMQHKSVVRKRLAKLTAEAPLPETGTPIVADGKPVGTIGTVAGNAGLSIVRLDRIKNANRVEAGGIPLTFALPEWVQFNWPDTD